MGNNGKAEVLTEANFNETTKEGVVMVDFFAQWCGPCKMIAPVIDELAEEYKGKATISKVDVDASQGLAAEFGVRSIPTILFIKNGEVKDVITGAASKESLQEKIDGLL